MKAGREAWKEAGKGIAARTRERIPLNRSIAIWPDKTEG